MQTNEDHHLTIDVNDDQMILLMETFIAKCSKNAQSIYRDAIDEGVHMFAAVGLSVIYDNGSIASALSTLHESAQRCFADHREEGEEFACGAAIFNDLIITVLLEKQAAQTEES